MYLKHLEIQGFKSFADKTTLDFLPPRNGFFSITGIVGPNGSGKSNITDAIRWVMGEQSMKQVRAKKSEDVIFNGSTTKGSLGVAEVTMVLDNMSAEVSAPPLSTSMGGAGARQETVGEETRRWNELPEITITRRLYRNGESEYLVNNQSTRLIDIHILLAQAQFAEHSYSIVSQGMIDRLLTVTPSERKDFFDEACGIKEHQIKQHQATLKLSRSEENMRQAETVLLEVEPRLKLLAKQVKKRERRREIEMELTEAQEQYYSTLHQQWQVERAAVLSARQAIDVRYRSAFQELEQSQTELAELARASSRQEIFEKMYLRQQEAAQQVNEIERQLAILDGQIHLEYGQVGGRDRGWLEEKVSALKTVNESARGLWQECVGVAELEDEKARRGREEMDRLTVEQTQLKLKISRLQAQLLNNQSEQNYLQFSGLTAVKAVLEAQHRLGAVLGIVAQLGRVKEEYALALEVAAGSHLSSLVVGDETVARAAIEYLRDNRLGVATFLPVNKIQPRGNYGEADRAVGERGVHGLAIDLVQFEASLNNIFSFVFGSTLVVENLQVAERLGIGRLRMVTLAGDLVELKGVMRGGWRHRTNGLGFSSTLSLNNDRLAGLQTEMQITEQTLGEVERALDEKKNIFMSQTVAATSSRERAAFRQSAFEQGAAESARLEQELTMMMASPEAYGEQVAKLSQEKKILAKTLLSKKKEAAAVGMEIKEFNTREEAKQQRVFLLQKQMQDQQLTVNNIVNERNERAIELAKLDTKEEDLATEVMNDMKMSLASIVERVEAAVSVDQLPALAETIQKMKYQLSLIGGIDEEVVTDYQTTKERYDFLVGQLTDLRAAVTDLNSMIEELNELMKKKRAVAFKKIRQEFNRYFKILFDGGSADLEEIYGVVEEEAEEGLETEKDNQKLGGVNRASQEKMLTGIEVIANPPGKKVKYLNMLSGGERTLTSIALISAILFHNPAPFVVLDEVEAALDETNTTRFAKIVAELATHSQFIIVTHNRVIMHAANMLYGAVMGVDGVSKLLSVKMEETGAYTDDKNQG